MGREVGRERRCLRGLISAPAFRRYCPDWKIEVGRPRSHQRDNDEGFILVLIRTS